MNEHELIDGIAGTILERIRGDGDPFDGTVELIHLRIGEFELASVESFLRAFAARLEGTSLEGVDVDLALEPAWVDCPDCGYRGPADHGLDGEEALPMAECPQCQLRAQLVGGRGVPLIQLSLARAA